MFFSSSPISNVQLLINFRYFLQTHFIFFSSLKRPCNIAVGKRALFIHHYYYHRFPGLFGVEKTGLPTIVSLLGLSELRKQDIVVQLRYDLREMVMFTVYSLRVFHYHY